MLFCNTLRSFGVVVGCMWSMGFSLVAAASLDAAGKLTIRVPSPVASRYHNPNSLVVQNPVLLTSPNAFRTALSGLQGLEGSSLGVLFEGARAAQRNPPSP